MNYLRIGFADTYQNAKDFFTEVLSRKYEVIRDDKNPEYLIFGDKNFGQSHYQYANCKKIFFTGENVRPTYYTHDYAVTFDFENSPKHYRLPLYVLEMWAIVHDNKVTEDFLYLTNKNVDLEKIWVQKNRGIAYIQSNPYCQVRTKFMEFLLNTSVAVSCGGPHLNNIGYVIPRDRVKKMEFFQSAYFGIAFENGSHPGYVTEKLIDCYYANTLPLYWGSDPISRDFNPKSMVQYKDFKSDEDLLKYLNHLRNDKKEYLDILAQPAFIGNIPNEYTNLNTFLDWFDTFVYQPSERG